MTRRGVDIEPGSKSAGCFPVAPQADCVMQKWCDMTGLSGDTMITSNACCEVSSAAASGTVFGNRPIRMILFLREGQWKGFLFIQKRINCSSLC